MRDNAYKFFDRKVLISSLYTKQTSHINKKPVCYHPTDWIFFGLAEDLKIYFDIPLADNENFFNWTYKNIENSPYPTSNERYYIEQYYFINAFSKKFNLDYEDITCWNQNNIDMWKQLLINNFIVIDNITWGIFSRKHIYLNKENNGINKTFKGLIWESDYKFLYDTLLRGKNASFYRFKSLIEKKLDWLQVKRKLKAFLGHRG